jgi:hypothetical protein
MANSWNGYLVRTLNQLASVYRARRAAPSHSAKATASAIHKSAKKFRSGRGKRSVQGLIGGAIVTIVVAAILRRIS